MTTLMNHIQQPSLEVSVVETMDLGSCGSSSLVDMPLSKKSGSLNEILNPLLMGCTRSDGIPK
jgi:hypothetical protein